MRVGVAIGYVGARRLSAPFDDAQGNRHMRFFQQPARLIEVKRHV